MFSIFICFHTSKLFFSCCKEKLLAIYLFRINKVVLWQGQVTVHSSLHPLVRNKRKMGRKSKWAAENAPESLKVIRKDIKGRNNEFVPQVVFQKSIFNLIFFYFRHLSDFWISELNTPSVCFHLCIVFGKKI